MKKRLPLLLATLFVFFSSACGAGTENATQTGIPQNQSTNETTSNVDVILTTDYQTSNVYYTAEEYGALTDLWGVIPVSGTLYALSEAEGVFSLIRVDGEDCYELYQAPEDSYLLWLAGNGTALVFVQSTIQEDTEKIALYSVDVDGNNLKELSISSVPLDNISGIAMDALENLYFLSDSGVQIVDAAGNELTTFIPAGQPIGLLGGNDGCVYVASYLGDNTCVEQIDPTAEEACETYTFSETQWQILGGFDEWLFLLNCEDQLLGYDGKTLTEIINWSANSIRPSALAAVWENTQDVLCYYDQNRLYQLSQADKADIPETSNLTLGVWESTNLESIITFYQKQHPEVTVDIRQYSLSEGMTELNLELAAGDGPDLLDLAWVNYAAYVSKGVLADLVPFLSEESLSMDDFIGSDVLKTGDSLYVLPTCFTVNTWKGLSDTFGTETSWTWEQYQSMQDGLSEGQDMTALSPEDFLSNSLSELVQECVDMSDATCDFSPLQDVLAAANACDFSGQFESTDLDDGTVKLEGAYISSIEEYSNYVEDGHYTLIGMPSINGSCTAYYTFSCLLGINAASGNIDSAWDLVYYAVCEYPREDMVNIFGISCDRSIVETEIDQRLDPASRYGDVEITGSEEEGYTIDGVYYEPGLVSMTPSITQEVVTSFWDYLDVIALYYAYDSEIADIVQEESAAYFNGDKSVEDVIDVIENRVSIYLAEQQ